MWLDLDLFRYRTLIAKLKNSQPDFDIASNFGNMLDSCPIGILIGDVRLP